MAKATTAKTDGRARGPKKQRAPFTLPPDVIERMRNAVVARERDGETMAALGERAIRNELDRLERERGAPFPPRRRDPKAGRPVGS